MSTRINLAPGDAEKIQAQATKFVTWLSSLVAATAGDDPNMRAHFVASIAAQVIARGQLVNATDDTMAGNVLSGGAEGLGMLLAHVADPEQRMLGFLALCNAMKAAMESEAAIHTPEGNA